MALTIDKNFNADLSKPINVRYGGGLVFTGDAGADTFNVHLYKDGEQYLPGGSVALNCIRADGNTVTVSGTISGNVASATLTQACCAIPGPLTVVMQIVSGGNTGAVFAAAYSVMPAQTGNPIDPGTMITNISALIAEIDAAVDSIPADYSELLAAIAPNYSQTTYAVGDYVWHEGDLYRCISAITVGEAWTAAHWTQVVFGEEISDLKTTQSSSNIDLWYAEQKGFFCPDFELTQNGRLIMKKGNVFSSTWKSSNNVRMTSFITGTDHGTEPTTDPANITPTQAQLVALADLTSDDNRRNRFVYSIVSSYTGSTKSAIYVYYCRVSNDTVTVLDVVHTGSTVIARYNGVHEFLISPPAGTTHFAIAYHTGGAGAAFSSAFGIVADLIVSQRLVAPVLNGFVADANLSVNDFRIIQDELYIITQNIANGGTIIVGTNARKTTISAALTALLNAQ